MRRSSFEGGWTRGMSRRTNWTPRWSAVGSGWRWAMAVPSRLWLGGDGQLVEPVLGAADGDADGLDGTAGEARGNGLRDDERPVRGSWPPPRGGRWRLPRGGGFPPSLGLERRLGSLGEGHAPPRNWATRWRFETTKTKRCTGGRRLAMRWRSAVGLAIENGQ
jgi:hypothetical protein